MAKKKILKQNGTDILPITHESCVLDNNSVPISTKIGSLSQLNTDNKSNLVAAINSVVDFNAETKQLLVDALNAKGLTSSTSDSWQALTSKITSTSECVEGTVAMNSSIKATGTYTFNALIGFIPDFLFIELPAIIYTDISSSPVAAEKPMVNNVSRTTVCLDTRLSSTPTWSAIISKITTSSFDLQITCSSSSAINWQSGDIKWYAMRKTATDGTRIKSIFNVEVVNSLPATVVQDKICIVEPNTNVNILMDYLNRDEALIKYGFKTNDIYIHLSQYEASNGYTSVMYDGTVMFKYNVCSIYRHTGSGLTLCPNVYKGVNGQWVQVFGAYTLFGGGLFHNNVSMVSSHSYYWDAVITGENLSFEPVNSGTSYIRTTATTDTFDVTNYKYLYVRISGASWGSLSGGDTADALHFGICNASDTADDNKKYVAKASITIKDIKDFKDGILTEKILKVDLTSITGLYKVKVMMDNKSSYGGYVLVSDMYFSTI